MKLKDTMLFLYLGRAELGIKKKQVSSVQPCSSGQTLSALLDLTQPFKPELV